MTYFWHYALQFSHIAIFAALLLLPRWRHTAMIMMAFAAGGILLLPYYIVQAELDVVQYHLLLAGIDLSAGFVLFLFGSNGSLRLASTQLAFFFAHFLYFHTASGVPTILDRGNYEMVLYALQLSQIIIVSDGIKEIGEEAMYVFAKVSGRGLVDSSAGNLRDDHPPGGQLGGRGSAPHYGRLAGPFHNFRSMGIHSKKADK